MSTYQEGPPKKQNSNPKILHKQNDPEGPWVTRDPGMGLEILLCSQKYKPRAGMQDQRAEGETRAWGPGCSSGHAPSSRPRPISLNGARAQIALLQRIQTAPPVPRNPDPAGAAGGALSLLYSLPAPCPARLGRRTTPGHHPWCPHPGGSASLSPDGSFQHLVTKALSFPHPQRSCPICTPAPL